MTEPSTTSDPKPPTNPPCAECGSTLHTTGYHDGGAPPQDNGTVSPTGYHDGGLVSPDFGKDAAAPGENAEETTDAEKTAEGHHEGGSPAEK